MVPTRSLLSLVCPSTAPIPPQMWGGVTMGVSSTHLHLLALILHPQLHQEGEDLLPPSPQQRLQPGGGQLGTDGGDTWVLWEHNAPPPTPTASPDAPGPSL